MCGGLGCSAVWVAEQFGMLGGAAVSQHSVRGMQRAGGSAAAGSHRRAPVLGRRQRQGQPCRLSAVPGVRQGPPARGRCAVPAGAGAPGGRVGDGGSGGSWGAPSTGRGRRCWRAAAAGSGSGIAASDCHDNTAVTNPLPDGITPASACSARGLLWRPAPVGTTEPSSPGDTPAGTLLSPEGNRGGCGHPQPPQRCGGFSLAGCEVPVAPVRPGAGRAGPPWGVPCPVPARGRPCPQEAELKAVLPSKPPGLVCRESARDQRARVAIRWPGISRIARNPFQLWRRHRAVLRTEVRGIAPRRPLCHPTCFWALSRWEEGPPLLFPGVRPLALVTPRRGFKYRGCGAERHAVILQAFTGRLCLPVSLNDALRMCWMVLRRLIVFGRFLFVPPKQGAGRRAPGGCAGG